MARWRSTLIPRGLSCPGPNLHRMAAETGGPGHVFISYVREDRERVDRLQEILASAGIDVWRDTEKLWPGQDWKLEIRRAITDGSLVFIACFSRNSVKREVSYQNEELVLAVEQMRQRPPGRSWLLPVRFDDVSLPEYDLGAGRTLESLQRIDLFNESWERAAARLVAAVLRILGGRGTAAAYVEEISAGGRLKRLLLDRDRRIEVEDLVAATTKAVRSQLQDGKKFPVLIEAQNERDIARFVSTQATAYASAVSPVVDVLVPGSTWGLPEHELIWTRTMGEIVNADTRAEGLRVLLSLARFPALVALYAAGIAAVHRGRFGTLRAVALGPEYRSLRGSIPLVCAVHPHELFEGAEAAANLLVLEAEGGDDRQIEAMLTGRTGRRYTPLSDYLHLYLRSHFADLIVDDREYDEVFDKLEVLLGIVVMDLRLEGAPDGGYVPGPWYGSFTWRNRSRPPLEQRLLARLQAQGSDAPELQGGLFGGSSDGALRAAERFVASAAEVRQQRR